MKSGLTNKELLASLRESHAAKVHELEKLEEQFRKIDSDVDDLREVVDGMSNAIDALERVVERQS